MLNIGYADGLNFAARPATKKSRIGFEVGEGRGELVFGGGVRDDG